MKKIMKYLSIFLIFFFAMPIILSCDFKPKSKQTLNENTITDNNNFENTQKEENSIAEDSGRKIRLLHNKDNTVEEMDLEEYLYGVVSSEMPASFEEEALKAQAVVARTYTLYKIMDNEKKHAEADICDDSACCQAWISKEERFSKWNEDNRQEYWDKIVKAVNETKGEVITYSGKPIHAFFHSNSGGKTEAPYNVWGGNDYPYLQTVATSGEEAYTQYASEITISKQDFVSKIKEKHSDFEINFNENDCIKILEYTESGRVKTIKVGNENLSGVEVRSIMGLKSANFQVEIEGDNITFNVKGYGHGVGMSQTGADSLAKQGKNYEEIIKHFYSGVEIETEKNL